MNLRELLADIQHAIWAHWMKYMFTQGTYNDDGTWTMPKEKVNHWTRQMNTNYAQLTERERDSDRDQAVKILKALSRYFTSFDDDY